MREDRDPYAAPHAPKSKSGPLLRYVIVGVLLAAGATAFVTMADGPGLTQSAEQAEQAEPQMLADTSNDLAPSLETPTSNAPSATPTPAPQRTTPNTSPAPSTSPEPAEETPPPSTVTVPPAD